MTEYLEQPYLDLLQEILDNGEEKKDRTGVGTKSLFGKTMRFDLSKGFPAITTKKLAFKTMTNELLWFIGGFTSVQMLKDRKCRIWNEWEKEDGTIGPMYGKTWRNWETVRLDRNNKPVVESIDQLRKVIEQIKTNPDSRRHVVSAWKVEDLDEMTLNPCHVMFQFYVSNDKKLSCHLFQRSCDFFLGATFNLASYSLLTHIVADLCDLEVGDFVHTIGDAHIYMNHIDQAKEQLSRKPYPAPSLIMPSKRKDIDDYALGEIEASDFGLKDYVHHPAIKAPIAV